MATRTLTCLACGRTKEIRRRQTATRYCSLKCFHSTRIKPDNPYFGQEHVAIAEKALGKPLPRGAQVHHVDGNGRNNSNNNLVICPDYRYHALLHTRQRIVDFGGDPNTQKICSTCKEVKDRSEFTKHPTKGDGLQSACRKCH